MKACDEFKGNYFEFQVPDREKGFYGSHFRQNCLIQPTKLCLITITELPFFICPLDEIEIVCFERTYVNSRTFDMVIVKKDYENFSKINAIPIQDDERIKNWLDDCNIVFYDQRRPLNWVKFLSTIKNDFKKFVEDGGWMVWDEADEEEHERSDESFSASNFSSDS